MILFTTICLVFHMLFKTLDAQEEKPKNIVIKLKNKKISPAEEWTYPHKISEDTSRCNTHPDNLRRILLKE